jgi:nicotinamidase-related amidase
MPLGVSLLRTFVYSFRVHEYCVLTARACGFVMANNKSPDLHGNAPDKSPIALLLVDVINDFEFDQGAEALFRFALPAAKEIAVLKQRANHAGVPSIYVNDNFGKWRSDFRALVAHCIDDDTRGRPIAELLKPTAKDYFVLKPKQSGFYSTTLDLLLQHLGARTLILTGFSTDICVLFTASDAHLRDYHLIVPQDCVAAQDEDENERVLKYMERVLEADVRTANEIDLTKAQADVATRRVAIE